MSREIKHGSTDQKIRVRFVDITTGEPETGVVAATAGLALWYQRDTGAKVAIGSLSDLAAVDSTHVDGGIKHISDGWYIVCTPDAACASGAADVLFGGSATGMVCLGSCYALVANLEADTYAKASDTYQVVAVSGAVLAADQSTVTVGAVSGAVGSVSGNVGGNVVGSVGSVTGNVGGNVTGSIGSLATQAKADVNTEADAALADVGVTTTVTGRIDAAVSTRLATAGYTAPPSAATVAAAVLGYVTSGTRTLQEVIALIEALVGVRTGVSSSPGSVVLKNPEGNKTRATATSDGAGNVSAVSIGDLTP